MIEVPEGLVRAPGAESEWAPQRSIPEDSGSAELHGENRFVSVLFADVVNSVQAMS